MLRNSLSDIRTTAGSFLVFSLCCAAGLAQQPRQYTAQDYAAAERFMPYNVNPLAYKGVMRAQWLDDGRFWYRDVELEWRLLYSCRSGQGHARACV